MPEASGSEVADESDYSIFENKAGLAEDMKFLASMPELCDVTFLVGDTKEPICAVKAVLAARSRFVLSILSNNNNLSGLFIFKLLKFENSQSFENSKICKDSLKCLRFFKNFKNSKIFQGFQGKFLIEFPKDSKNF